MAKVTVALDKTMLQRLLTKGSACTAFQVEEGISPQANLQKAWIDEYGVLRFQFEDPEAEKDGEVQVLWKFESAMRDTLNFVFLIKDLKLAETTHWGNSTRLRFVKTENSKFEVKFDIPMEVGINVEGPFFIACGKDKL